MQRPGKKPLRIGHFYYPRGVHHRDIVGSLSHNTQIMRYQQNTHPFPLLQVIQQIKNLGLNGYIKSGRRFISYQKFRFAAYRHCYHNPLSHPARHLVRILTHTLLWVGYANLSKHLDRIRPGLTRVFALMKPDCLDDLVAHRIDRIKTGHRLLENHSNLIAANTAHPLFAKLKQISFAENNLTCNNLPRRRRH